MMRHEALEEVSAKAEVYTTAKKAFEDSRTELDKALLNAKEQGATFRELSYYSHRSVGFTQKALSRQGYSTGKLPEAEPTELSEA